MAAVTRRAAAGTDASMAIAGRVAQGLECTTKGLQFRAQYFNDLYQTQQEKLDSADKGPITIVLADGSTREGRRHCTTPMDIAMGISRRLADSALVAKIDYAEVVPSLVAGVEEEPEEECCGASHEKKAQLWDMHRVLTGSCSINFLTFDDDEAKHVFWHSSAHILGCTLELMYGAHLTIGPALERGFYYDAYLGDLKISQEMYPKIEAKAIEVSKQSMPFQRLECTKKEALKLFSDNPFKVALIASKVPEGGMTSVYKCGTLIDLCMGPHVPNTGKVKAFSIEKHSAVYWLGTAGNDDLQRVYGISFPEQQLMKAYKTLVEEAKKRDHRTVGSAMNLFFFESVLVPGSCFWLPDGAKLYNKMQEFMRREYRFRGFHEVVTPNILSGDVFKTSGHLQNYQDCMYTFDVEGKLWAMKPMNCPAHCLMFRHMAPSYRQLPIRMADFGVLHRNEASGSLTGLTRVRRFQQDDAHIFARMDQVKDEVHGALEFLFYIYGVFGFTFELNLATRPKKALGSKELWDEAEAALAAALTETGKPWKFNPGDGAFYGPKIDIRLQDALQRWHQCGTVQLDFQLPLRFNLTYRTADNAAGEAENTALDKATDNEEERTAEQVADCSKAVDGSWEQPLKPGFGRPVMIHRAILGSLERMAAVLLEHTAGKFPFWLSPKQCLVLPVSEKFLGYAKYVADVLNTRGYDVSVDESNSTLNKKIRQGQFEKWNYLAVVGQNEMQTNQVTLRDRDNPSEQKVMSLTDMVEMFEQMQYPNSRKPRQITPFVEAE